MHTLCYKPFISFSEEPHNKTPKEVMDHLHGWISQLQVHPIQVGNSWTKSILLKNYGESIVNIVKF